MEQSSKTNVWPWVILIIIILVIGGYFCWHFLGNSGNKKISAPITPTNIVTTTSSLTSTANWKTYTNTQYGFSFKYPANLNSRAVSSNLIANFGGGPEDVFSAQLLVYIYPQKLNDFEKQEELSYTNPPLDFQPTTVGGRQAFKTTKMNGDETVVLIDDSSQTLLITDKGSYTQGIDTVLSTFQFTK